MTDNLAAENEWILQDNDAKSINCGKKFKFGFEQFEAEKLKALIKSYVWHNYQTGNLALRTIYLNYRYFKKFSLFASQNGIDTLADFNANDADNFMTYLRITKSTSTGIPLRYTTQAGIFAVLKSIVYWGQVFAPELVPAQEVFVGSEYPNCNAVHKIEYIPDSVVKQINTALLTEENPYIKYGFIILFSTGMRISELLNLEANCVTPHLLNGDTLSFYDFKKRRHYRKLPINPACAEAISALAKITDETRKKADTRTKKFLFIYEIKFGTYADQVRLVSQEVFESWINGKKDCKGYYYPGFMDRHNITGSNGKIYRLKTHQFRKTLATDMFSKNVDIKVIQELLRHAYPGTVSKYYADDKDIDRAIVFEKVGVIGNINNIDGSVIAGEAELAWFKENKDKGAKMCDGYCAMPVVNGKICERLANRQKCYTCNHYITTPEYLQSHKEHLAELEVQLANNIYGAHYAAHLTPNIDILKDIIERSEAIKHES